MAKVLLIDDEATFRESLAQRLTLRGYDNRTLNSGTDAIKVIRKDPEIDVVILDRKMPDGDGEQVLKEIKAFRPELQVVMLTGFGSTQSAVEVGKHDAFAYLEKPCEVERLIEIIEAARREKVRAMARHEIPYVEKHSVWQWLIGSHNSRPLFILLGMAIFLCLYFMPVPQGLIDTVSIVKTGELTDHNLGYADYAKMKIGESIAQYYGNKYKLEHTEINAEGKKVSIPLTSQETGRRAMVMLGVLMIAAVFWGTGALPIGITALLVGVILYFFGVLTPDDVAAAYAKDAVIFIFGVLAMSRAISKTGLDRRIGILLLGSSTSLPKFLFIFLPLVGICCSFLSEHAIVAFMMPILMIVYASSVQAAGGQPDRRLAVMLVLSLCYAANCGGPGSPAAGGRNAVMVGILTDYGISPSFGEWVKYGLPFVPVMAVVIGIYFYFVFFRKIHVRELNVSAIVTQASRKIGPMNQNEYITSAILLLLITLWVTCSDIFGMGGPVILAVILLNLFRVISWRDIAKIQWEVVALYASACAMGKGLATTGAALYLAQSFVNALPGFFQHGEGLAMAASIFTGVTTQFMSDGATVSAIGPITIPMAIISGTHPWMVGFASAFGSSFAHTLLIGTPNNAIAYAMAKDPVTGEQLITLSDFAKHGFFVLLLSWLVLWTWTLFGYWRWIGF